MQMQVVERKACFGADAGERGPLVEQLREVLNSSGTLTQSLFWRRCWRAGALRW